MSKFIASAKKFLKSEDGPTAVEYAVMVALIIIVCIASVDALGEQVNSTFGDITTDLQAATP